MKTQTLVQQNDVPQCNMEENPKSINPMRGTSPFQSTILYQEEEK